MGRRIVCIGRGGIGRAFSDKGILTFGRDEVDVTDICSLEDMFDSYDPVVVINCTGVVGTGKCALEPEYTNMVNVGGVSNIVHLCKKHGSFLVHMSTFYCGDFNVYSKSKEMAESIVSSSNIGYLIVRLPWVFGKYTENFIQNLARRKKCGIFRGERGYLAYDEDICDYVINSIGNEGLVSIANEGELSRDDIVRYFDAESIVEVVERKVDMPISVPPPDVKMRPWQMAMEDFVNGLRSS